ncbi:sphingosine N-acyltransferase lag1 [Linnemannia exigua]|uniref:Transcription initiation factor TFIID subunit 11 n=1 Tax=Linnemannia exigua TaxID=604196 RepID=A0AAD4DDE1_9FUNG|nr:sphingosine N-acyltransferase lag1 [Linnemannia exigua]
MRNVPAAIIAVVLVSHFQLRIPLAETCLFLQNQDPMTGLYSKAWTDLNFIGFWIVVFTFLRAFVMTVILKPFALWAGVQKEHQQNRFQEEGWVCIYYSISWTLGMYVLRTSPVWNSWTFWFKPEALFEGYPHTQLPHVMLWYYYVQLAFWLQQIFVLHVEAPRKDFWALMAHHTVTLLLISGSALSNFWRAGNVVFVVMDLADIILAFSKSMKYLGVPSKICDVFFGTFMVTWLYTRHYMYAYILHGFMFTAYEMIPFELDISQGKWYCRELAWLPILGLALLQILMVYWFALILRILVKILKGHSAEDERSEDESEPVQHEEKKIVEMDEHGASPGPSTPTAPATPTKRRKNAAAASLPKPKKQKLPRNLDSITARNQLPNAPPSGAGAGGVGKTGQRMVKGPYKKREKKDKDGKKIPAGAAAVVGGSVAGGAGGGKKGKGGAGGKAGAGGAGGAGVGAGNNTTGDNAHRADQGTGLGSGGAGQAGAREDDDYGEIRKPGTGANGTEGGEGAGEGGDAGGEGKDEDDDDHEEEPEYTELEWNQEASSRGRSKDELKALLDCFSDEQLQRYEVYRRSVLSRPTVKKLVGTILNQQVTQTMAFVVAGFCKVFVGEMVEKAREVMEDWGETGPIRPEHLREAQRRYKKEEVQQGNGVQTSYGYKRRMFCR